MARACYWCDALPSPPTPPPQGFSSAHRCKLSPTFPQPAVTIGNVGQLAADLIISTGEMPLAGYLESRYVLPCVGNDAFKRGGGPTVALEVRPICRL